MPGVRWSKRKHELQEIARRVSAGERPAEIARAMGLSPWVAQTKSKEIAAALKVPTDADRRAELDRCIAPLVEQGLTDPGIAERLGVSYGQAVGARKRACGPKFTLVRLTPEEHALVGTMVREGFSAREIAAELGCSTSLVCRRATKIDRSTVRTTRPPCGCGKPAGHAGGCPVLVDPSLVRERILAGATSADIARELGLRATGDFKKRHCQPVIDALTAEGLRCACGQPFGHRFMCKVTGARQRGSRDAHPKPPSARKATFRTRLSAEQLAAIKRGLRRGDSGTRIAAAVGLRRQTVTAVIRRLRATTNNPLKPCGCGRPARHPGACSVNAPAHAITKLEKTRIAQGIREGTPPHEIASRLGISSEAVLRHSSALREQLFAGGVTCACGRLLGHPRWCSAKWESFNFPSRARSLPTANAASVRAALMRGEAASDISAATGVSVNRIWGVRHELTDADRAQRARLVRARLGHGRLNGRELVGLVKAAVSSRLEVAVRDEVVAELHLAVIEGRIEPEQIAAAAKRLTNDALREQLHGRTRSMDETIHVAGHGDELTLGATLGDRVAEEALGEIQIGQPPP